MQCQIHPHLMSETSWSTVFWRRCWRDRNVAAFVYRAWIHTGRANLHPQGSCLNSAQSQLCISFSSGLLTTQHRVGRSVGDQPPSGQLHIVLRLSEPVYDLLTHYCSLSEGREGRGTTCKDHRLAASGMERQQAELFLPRAAIHDQHTAGRRDHNGDRQLQ